MFRQRQDSSQGLRRGFELCLAGGVWFIGGLGQAATMSVMYSSRISSCWQHSGLHFLRGAELGKLSRMLAVLFPLMYWQCRSQGDPEVLALAPWDPCTCVLEGFILTAVYVSNTSNLSAESLQGSGKS